MTFNENGVLTSGGSPQAVTFDFAGAQQNQAINLVLGSASGEGHPPSTAVLRRLPTWARTGTPPACSRASA